MQLHYICHAFSIQQVAMFVYRSIEDHMFNFLTWFFIPHENNLPKYSFHSEHQSHISGLCGRARKTPSFAGEPREVAIEWTHCSFKELFPLTIRDWWNNLLIIMVAYFCHHLSDNDVDLSVIYVDLPDHYVDLTEKYHYNY